MKKIEWYWFGDCRCVVGTTFAFEDEKDMHDYFGDAEFIEIETPDYAEEDMIEY